MVILLNQLDNRRSYNRGAELCNIKKKKKKDFKKLSLQSATTDNRSIILSEKRRDSGAPKEDEIKT